MSFFNISTNNGKMSILPKNTYIFSPKLVTGLILWVDATDPLNTGIAPANNSTITTWYDKSGLGNNATANAGITYNTTGLNNKPTLTFAGTQCLNGNIINTNTTMSVFGICYMNNAGSTYQRLIGFSSGSGVHDFNNNSFLAFFRNAGTTSITPYRNAVSVANSAPSYSTPYLYECWFDGTKEYATVQIGNTTTINNTSSSGNFAISYYTIANNTNNSDGAYFNGFISEVVVYNT